MLRVEAVSEGLAATQFEGSVNKAEETMPLVSIVCVSHGRHDLLLRCLKSCLEQNFTPIEIVVVLNPRNDDCEKAIRKAMPQVMIIRTHRNIGIYPALNLAIANSSGEYVLTLDDDSYFLAADVISRLVDAFIDEPELGAATCNLEGPHEKTLVGEDRYVASFKAGFTMVPRKAFTEWVGYYPEIFFRAGAETFLSTALWDSGRPVKCLINARMYHAQAMQGRSDHDWKFYGIRSQALCTIMREPWFIVPFSLLSKFLKSMIHYTRWGHFSTWLKAWWSTAFHFSEALRWRHPISFATYKRLHRVRQGVVTKLEPLR